MKTVISVLPARAVKALSGVPADIFKSVSELTLRLERPSTLRFSGSTRFISPSGLTLMREKALLFREDELSEFYERICKSSVYSFEEQIKNGFVTLTGGHRVGLCGTAVMSGGYIRGLRELSGFVIRIAREVEGCGTLAANYILSDSRVKNTLIAAPPGGGKTTLLRDLSRIFCERGLRVCVIDERSELAASVGGVPSFMSCALCEILDGCPKTEGVLRAVRTLSPDVIVLDELGTVSEAESLLQAMNSGVSFVLTAHAGTFREALSRPAVAALVKANALSVIVTLGSCKVAEIRNIDNGEVLYEAGGAYINSGGMLVSRAL